MIAHTTRARRTMTLCLANVAKLANLALVAAALLAAPLAAPLAAQQAPFDRTRPPALAETPVTNCLGVDFTSAPTKRKPITVARGSMPATASGSNRDSQSILLPLINAP